MMRKNKGVGIFYFDKEKASRYNALSKKGGIIPTGLVHNINDDGSPVKGFFKKYRNFAIQEVVREFEGR